MLGAQGPQLAPLEKGGFVTPNPATQNAFGARPDYFANMVRGVGADPLGASLMRTLAPGPRTATPRTTTDSNEKGGTTPQASVTVNTPAAPTPTATAEPDAAAPGTVLPDPVTYNAFSPEVIRQMTARAVESANMQNRNRNAGYVGQASSMGLTGPNIGGVLSQPSTQDAARVGAQAATDSRINGMSMGLQQQQLGMDYYRSMLQMLLGGLNMSASDFALPQYGSKGKQESYSKSTSQDGA
jgi:hypothetical protein